MRNPLKHTAAALAVFMICAALIPLISVTVLAAAEYISDGKITSLTYASNGENVKRLRSGDSSLMDMTIEYSHFFSTLDFNSVKGRSSAPISDADLKNSYIQGAFTIDKKYSSIKVIVDNYDTAADEATIIIKLYNVKYNDSKTLHLKFPVDISNADKTVTITYQVDLKLSPSDFINDNSTTTSNPTTPGGSSTGDDESDAFTSDIVVEQVRAFDKDGKVIRDITKDTEPFSVEVTFTDQGLWEVYEDDWDAANMSAFLTDAGSFMPQGSFRGTMSQVYSRTGDPPRFTATFNNLKYAGGTAAYSEIKFRIYYDIYGYSVKGDAAARYYGVTPDESDEDKDKTAPPTPYIIIKEYDLGASQIEAGSTFTLTVNFANTSKDISLENIRMVVNPVSTEQQQSYLSIASSTNTYYYESLTAGAGKTQSVDILVKGSATVGSQAISLDFTYEYVNDKTREKGTTSTTIYIPITQIDRFTVDPLTDFYSYIQLGDEGYATVSFANLGKSTTYNVSGHILDAEGNQGQTEHFGNLEAGASGSLEFTYVPTVAGDYNGTIVIRYENENGEEKEVVTEFTAYVEEPWYQQNPDPGMIEPEEPEAPKTPWWRYLLFVTGGLAIAAPIALYLFKRVQAKGIEDFDEDF